MLNIACPECHCIAGHDKNCTRKPEYHAPGTKALIDEMRACMDEVDELLDKIRELALSGTVCDPTGEGHIADLARSAKRCLLIRFKEAGD